ncbi:hypothetical protein IE53DRAFT_412735 [Violaceomyces palustris]|uniref:Uncharacterized protein n=1 Tax=Violaceomyces palustris TaxID=1673888 RepID=A0ACD0NQ19_9BASI|nr:hypothetical protein IE53DRAFT_412735 [Violaceomyces palustris]
MTTKGPIHRALKRLPPSIIMLEGYPPVKPPTNTSKRTKSPLLSLSVKQISNLVDSIEAKLETIRGQIRENREQKVVLANEQWWDLASIINDLSNLQNRINLVETSPAQHTEVEPLYKLTLQRIGQALLFSKILLKILTDL